MSSALTLILGVHYAAAAASLCVRTKGTIPSMPDRKAVLLLLKEQPVVEEKISCPDEQVVLLLKEHSPFADEKSPEASATEEKKAQPLPITAG